jgi:hypothetical protein
MTYASSCHPFADLARFEEATHRTTRWLDRCIAAHKRPNEQNLFPIVQVRRLAVTYTHVSKRLLSLSGLITALDDFACKTTCMLWLGGGGSSLFVRRPQLRAKAEHATA